MCIISFSELNRRKYEWKSGHATALWLRHEPVGPIPRCGCSCCNEDLAPGKSHYQPIRGDLRCSSHLPTRLVSRTSPFECNKTLWKWKKIDRLATDEKIKKFQLSIKCCNNGVVLLERVIIDMSSYWLRRHAPSAN